MSGSDHPRLPAGLTGPAALRFYRSFAYAWRFS
jgi:hypothetical protein